jgi:hypothetical protein
MSVEQESFEWSSKVKSTKTIGSNKHNNEVLTYCCLNPLRPAYALVLTEEGNVTELEAKYLKEL